MELEVESNSPLTARFGSTFHEIIFLAGTSCRNVYLTFEMLDLRTTVVPAIPVDSNLVTTRRKTAADYCRNVEIDPPTTTASCVKSTCLFSFFLLATTPTQTTRFVKYWILAHLGFLSRTFPEQRFVTRCRVVKMAALPPAGLRLKYVATVSDSGSSSNMLWLGSIYEDN